MLFYFSNADNEKAVNFFTKLLKFVHSLCFLYVSRYVGNGVTLVSVLLICESSFRFENDETSPSYYDPLHPEDYCYEIMSRPVMKTAS
jgi:hypothetical protein